MWHKMIYIYIGHVLRFLRLSPPDRVEVPCLTCQSIDCLLGSLLLLFLASQCPGAASRWTRSHIWCHNPSETEHLLDVLVDSFGNVYYMPHLPRHWAVIWWWEEGQQTSLLPFIKLYFEGKMLPHLYPIPYLTIVAEVLWSSKARQVYT